MYAGTRGFELVTVIIMSLGSRKVINVVLLLPVHHLNMVLHYFVLLDVRLVLKGCVLCRTTRRYRPGRLAESKLENLYMKQAVVYSRGMMPRALSRASMQIHAERR